MRKYLKNYGCPIEYGAPLSAWQNLLDAITVVDGEQKFEDMGWTINIQSQKTPMYIEWGLLTLLSRSEFLMKNMFGDDPVTYCKKLWIVIMGSIYGYTKNVNSPMKDRHAAIFNSIVLTMYYLEQTKSLQICKSASGNSLYLFIYYISMNSVNKFDLENPIKTHSEPLSYDSVINRLIDDHWFYSSDKLKGWPQVGFNRIISKNEKIYCLRRMIEEFYCEEKAWGDYKNGGSFNKLPLDVGQYYVQHCMKIVEEYKEAALLISDIWNDIDLLMSKLNLKGRVEISTSIESILAGGKSPVGGLGVEKYKLLSTEINKRFRVAGFRSGVDDWSLQAALDALSITKKYSSRARFSKMFTRLVSSAATVCFAALSGWRQGEYLFSLSDIEIEKNIDPLTQKEAPLRFYVKGVVPKTLGDIPVRREIIKSQYDNLVFIRSVNNTPSTEFIFKDRRIVNKWLGEPWENFILSGSMPELIRAELLKELDYWQLKKSSHIVFYHIKNGSYNKLPLKQRGFLQSVLDEGVVRILNKGGEGSIPISDKELRKIASSVDIINPTSHAFRHMWVEAMMRRFDGDIGWLVRSQFQHLGERFWRYYAKDKSTYVVRESVKREVVSTLLQKVIRDRGNNYAGATLTMVRRLQKRTSVVDLSDEVAIETINDYFVEYKPTPWGYCLIRETSKKRAKCAEDGAPQQQNASPSLCLECPNYLTSSGHKDELHFIINTHVEVILSQSVPYPFKLASERVVKTSRKYLEKMGINLPKEVERKLTFVDEPSD